MEDSEECRALVGHERFILCEYVRDCGSSRVATMSKWIERPDGMFEQREDDRYIVRFSYHDSDFYSMLIDTRDNSEVWNDNMAPEDACLTRDLAPLVELINDKEREIQELKTKLDLVAYFVTKTPSDPSG